MDFIRRRLIWERVINRADIVARFGISPNQATADLRHFQNLHPASLSYDRKAKTYRAADSLRPELEDTVLLLQDLRLICEGVMAAGDGALTTWPAIATAEAPLRPAKSDVVAAVLATARQGRTLSIIYQSFSGPRPRRRLIEPHAFIFDGFRWHARARDAEDGAFKDFVLGRMSKPDIKGPVSIGPDGDRAWNTFITLTIAPHPNLSRPQTRAIEADYGMSKGQASLTTREATLFYVKRRLGLLSDHEMRPPEEQHIVLVNETTDAAPS